MASRASIRLFRATPFTTPSTVFRAQTCLAPRFYSTDAENADVPYIKTLKGQLKTFMRAKDMQRLTVLKSILAMNLNTSKTKKPFKTDADLIKAIMRMRRLAEESAEEAKQVGRDDLATKSLEEARIISEFEEASGVKFVDPTALRATAAEKVGELIAEGSIPERALLGAILPKVAEVYEGQDYDKKELVDIVKEELKKQGVAL